MPGLWVEFAYHGTRSTTVRPGKATSSSIAERIEAIPGLQEGSVDLARCRSIVAVFQSRPARAAAGGSCPLTWCSLGRPHAFRHQTGPIMFRAQPMIAIPPPSSGDIQAGVDRRLWRSELRVLAGRQASAKGKRRNRLCGDRSCKGPLAICLVPDWHRNGASSLRAVTLG